MTRLLRLGTLASFLIFFNAAFSQVSVFPWTDDFESYPTCGTFFNYNTFCVIGGPWTNTVPTGTNWSNWLVANGTVNGSSSGSTGPGVSSGQVDHTLGTTSGNYVFIECSGVGSFNTAHMEAEFDLSAMDTSTKLAFWYHMYGGAMGDLYVDISIQSGTGIFMPYATLDSILGQQQIAYASVGGPNGDWRERVVSLAPYVGDTIKLRFRGETGSSFTSDMALDDISIYEILPIDVSPNTLYSPVDTGECIATSQQLWILLENVGTDTLFLNAGDSIPLKVNIAGPIVQNYDTVLYATGSGSTFPPGATQQVKFGKFVDLSMQGTYTFDVITCMPLDSAAGNDTLRIDIQNNTISSYPFTEDFETFVTSTNGTGWQNGWVAEPEGPTFTYRWQPDVGGTGSFNTGPNVDHTTGTTAGVYIYTEASSGVNGNEASLISPCIDIDVVPCPTVQFWYHFKGTDIDRMDLDIFSNGTWTNSIYSIVGEQQLNQTDPWLLSDKVFLSAYGSGIVKLRFRATRGLSFAGDLAIDDVMFFDSPADEFASLEIIEPASGCGLDSTETISFIFKNNGCATQQNVNVNYMIDNSGTVITEVYPGPLAIAEIDTYTFTTPANIATPGLHTITVWTSLTNDTIQDNDSAEIVIQNYLIPPSPTVTDDTSCGFDSLLVLTAAGLGNQTYWFSEPTGGDVIGTGDTIYTPYLTVPTSYYVSSATTDTSTFTTSFAGGTGCRGNFFQVSAANTIEVDSFKFHVDDFLTHIAQIYYKQGNYIGFEQNAGAWSLLGNITINGSGIGQPTSVPIGGLIIPAGQTYSFMVALDDNSMDFTVGAQIFSNEDMVVSTGASFCTTLWSIPTTNRVWNGMIHYTAVKCESPRVPATAFVYEVPTVDLGNDTTICDGPAVILDAGNPTLDFLWNTGSTDRVEFASDSGLYWVEVTDTSGCNVRDTFNLDVLDLPNVDIGPDTANCVEYTMSFTDSSLVSYMWIDSSTNFDLTVFTTDEYWFQVTDTNNCTNRDSALITINPLPDVKLGPDISQCGASLVLDAVIPLATYNWSTNENTQQIIVTQDGTYSVEVIDMNGCVNRDTVIVDLHPNPVVNLGPDNALCNDSLLLDASNPGSSYAWNDGNLGQFNFAASTGNYIVTVTNPFGCTATDQIMVIVDNDRPSVDLGPDTIICNSYIVNGTGNLGTVYTWSTGDTTPTITVTTTGVYSLLATNACGTNTDAVNVTVDQPPVVSFTTSGAGPTITFNNTSTTSGSTTYNWDFGDGNWQSSSDPNYSPTHTYDFAGSYTVTLTVTNACGSVMSTQTVVSDGPGVGINEALFNAMVNVYPNPSKGVFTIEKVSASPEMIVKIFDVNYREVFSIALNEGDQLTEVDLSGFAKGSYLMKFSNDQSVGFKKLLIH